MGVLDKVFGKKQEVQPPTIPVAEQMPEGAPTPLAKEVMRETIPTPMEPPRPPMPEPEIAPTLEERRIEEVVPTDVFVKLDNFGDVLSEMTIIRAALLNLKSLNMVRGELNDMQADVGNLEKAFNEDIDKSLSSLEAIIEGVSGAAKRAKDVKYKAAKPKKSKAVEDLESRIKKLKTEIEGIKKK